MNCCIRNCLIAGRKSSGRCVMRWRARLKTCSRAEPARFSWTPEPALPSLGRSPGLRRKNSGAIRNGKRNRWSRSASWRQVTCLASIIVPAGGRLALDRRGGQQLAVHPGRALADPIFHPPDFILVALAGKPGGRHILAQDRPALIIADLGLAQERGQFVNARQKVGSREWILAQLRPARHALL